MDNNKNYIDDLIISFLINDIDECSLKKLNEWLDDSEDNKLYFNHIRNLWYSADYREDLFDKEAAYNRFLKRKESIVSTNSYNNIKPIKSAVLNRKPISILKYAAIFFIIFVFSYLSYQKGGQEIKGKLADVVVEAPLGSKLKITLPDGSLVWMNSGTRLTYSNGFGIEDRKLNLVGEAYFEVTHNEKIPFIVTSNDLKVQVLGTKFNFKNYADDSQTKVALIQGRVSVSNELKANDIVTLKPDQCVILDKNSKNMKVEDTDALNSIEWKNGYLFFDEIRLSDIAKILERCYNVKITIDYTSIDNFSFYGKFNTNEQSIRDILNLLSSTNKINYVIKGNHITIY